MARSWDRSGMKEKEEEDYGDARAKADDGSGGKPTGPIRSTGSAHDGSRPSGGTKGRSSGGGRHNKCTFCRRYRGYQEPMRNSERNESDGLCLWAAAIACGIVPISGTFVSIVCPKQPMCLDMYGETKT